MSPRHPGEATHPVPIAQDPNPPGAGHRRGVQHRLLAHIDQLASTLPPEYVLLTTENFEEMVVGFANAPATVTAGGGWEGVARPGRRGIPVWRGFDVPALTVSLLFDSSISAPLHPGANYRGTPSRPVRLASVEGARRSLEVMAGALVPHDPEPPQLIVIGKTITHDASQGPEKRWVIGEPPAWDPESIERRYPDGKATRQAVTLTLLLVDENEGLHRTEPRKRRPKFRVYHTKKGQNLDSVALHQLGSKRFARKLARFNHIKDPRKVLKTGTRIKLPTHDELRKWKRDLKGDK